jgi:hypothetical protein
MKPKTRMVANAKTDDICMIWLGLKTVLDRLRVISKVVGLMLSNM